MAQDTRSAVSRYRFGRTEVLCDERKLLQDGEPVAVGSRAFDTLVALVERHERIVSKDELLAVVWPNLVVEENNLQVHISALRKALGADVIATIPGRGYRFTAPLEAFDTPASSHRFDSSAAVAAGTSGSDQLFGRSQDLQKVEMLLASQRLVTLCGAGGIGKTRLALALVGQMAPQFRDGYCVIELAAIQEPVFVDVTVAQGLRVVPSSGQGARESVLAALKPSRKLLVFDNCEHLLHAVSDLLIEILREAPDVKVLVTSQEPLRVPQECVYRLEPLAVPKDRHAPDALQFGAVQLLRERVTSATRSSALKDDDLAAMVDICAQLDGLPLAIELAAARVPHLGLHGLRDRLDERFRLLTGGWRVTLRKHQTLRAALDWSHSLLTDEEQRVFRRLGMFTGGFTMEAAQHVASDKSLSEWDVLDTLSALVDKSLVLVDDRATLRYRLLEITRVYAMERLAEAQESDSVFRRHAEATVETFARAVRARNNLLLADELNNVRAAFRWAADDHGDRLIAVTLATTSSVVLAVAGLVSEALERLMRVEHFLSPDMATPLVAQYWQWVGRLGIDGRLPVKRCIDAFERALQLYERMDNTRHIHACLRMKAEALLDAGETDRAAEALRKALALENSATPSADRMRRMRVEALVEDGKGNSAQALQLAQTALALAQGGRIDRYVLILMSDIAGIHLHAKDFDQAAAGYAALATETRMRPSEGLTHCYALIGLTAALIDQNLLEEALASAREAAPLLTRSAIFIAHADVFALLMARLQRWRLAAMLIGAADAFFARTGGTRDATEARFRSTAIEFLLAGHVTTVVESWKAEGETAKEEELAAWASAADS